MKSDEIQVKATEKHLFSKQFEVKPEVLSKKLLISQKVVLLKIIMEENVMAV